MRSRRLVIDLLALHKDAAYGFQQYILNILDYFYVHREEIKYDRVILVCKKSEAQMLSKYADKFEIKEYGINNYISRLGLQTYIPIKLGLTSGDLLLSPGNTSGMLKRCPEILVIHDLLFKRKELCNYKVCYHRKLYIPRSIKKADKIVSISNFTKTDIEHYYPNAKGKIKVIYNPVHLSKYDCDCETGIAPGYFLAISSNVNYKNQRTILKAYQKYCDKGGKKRLVIIGMKDCNSEACLEYEQLPQMIKENITWLSHVSNQELGEIYRNASCYISASKFEGFGMPVTEAMSFGLPVILSDIPTHREVSQNKGCYFAPTDVNHLVSIMLDMDFHKRNYAESIRAAYSEENTSARYVELVNEMWKVS